MTLKIVSWNINSVRFRIEIVERFLREVSPDILCLQETKVIDGDFPTAPFRALGYKHIILHGQRMHHGVAIISRVPLVEDDRFDWLAVGLKRHDRSPGVKGQWIERSASAVIWSAEKPFDSSASLRSSAGRRARRVRWTNSFSNSSRGSLCERAFSSRPNAALRRLATAEKTETSPAVSAAQCASATAYQSVRESLGYSV
ncbi:Exodeoxyribonuclease III [hydrothermal vent metagenome]|uniref:Exodeoxyribonuclease III n=1 Tax=hydrothermal vent metagenome TaxID=652676 RepID=A0A160TI88_9ZZZZ